MIAMKGLQTEYEFILPRGYVDGDGNLHRKGVMRLATAMDEIAPMRDLRVKSNQASPSSRPPAPSVITSSRWRSAPRGNSGLPPRDALRGGSLSGLPLPLASRGAPGPGAS